MKKILNNLFKKDESRNLTISKKGVTLISLVITIVILIILVAVVISLTIGQNGLISRAKSASKEYENQQAAEKEGIENLYGELLVATDGTVNLNLDKLEQIILDKTYPVGSIYITIDNKNPSETLGGKWESVSSGRVLQGSDDNHGAGTTIEAGLPNITGVINGSFAGGEGIAFYTGIENGSFASGNDWKFYKAHLDASRSSEVYGNSDTVQPPAYVVNIWKRTK